MTPTDKPMFSIGTARLRAALVAAWVVVISGLILMAAVSFSSPLGRDSSAFAYVAKGILAGEIPYLDRWDHKGPVTYIVYALGFLISERWGLWLVEVASLLGSACLAFKVVNREFGTQAALFAVATLLIYVTVLGPGGGLTEHFALLLQLFALHLFLDTIRRDGPSHRSCFAIGILGTLSLLLRANLVGVWLAIGLYWVSRWRESGSSIVWSMLSGFAVLAATSLTFLYLGAWEDLWSATVNYNFAHSAASLDDRLRATMSLVWHLSPVVPLFGVGWCVGIWYQFSGRTRGETFEGTLPFLLILGPIEVALSLVSGNGWNHYNIPLLPTGVLYLGFLVWLVVKEGVAAPTFLSLLILFVTVNYHLDIYSKAHELVRAVRNTSDISELSEQDRDLRVAEIVERNSGAEDTILVWGAHSQFYLLTGRDSPTRFFYQYPLFKEGYSRESDLIEFYSDVVSAPPAVIVDTMNPRMPPLNQEGREEWLPYRQYNYEATRLQKFFEYVQANYRVTEVVGEHWVYVRTN